MTTRVGRSGARVNSELVEGCWLTRLRSLQRGKELRFEKGAEDGGRRAEGGKTEIRGR